MRRIGLHHLALSLWLAFLHLPIPASRADWPTLRSNAQRTGFVAADLPQALRLHWAVEFSDERLGTAMEPILGGGRLFVATHAGRLWALDAATGAPAWQFDARSPLLHSPAYADGHVYAATADGRIFALEARHGRLRWSYEGEREGYSASPLPYRDHLFLGSRAGTFVALDAETGIPSWEQHFDVPIRQSAAAADGKVWITLEDLTMHCLGADSGKTVWKAPPVEGQTARDYYPVIAQRGGTRYAIVRTAPSSNMADRLARDRAALARNAGIDDSDWRNIDRWCTNALSDVTPDRTRKEQEAILDHLGRVPEARTAFLWEADTGKPAGDLPLLWMAGCQAAPAPPVVMPDGRLFGPLRSAYGHWSLGVAPLVGVGFLDPATRALELINLQGAPKPPWNTFWGTADESHNLLAFRNATLFVHQGTIGRFDPASARLERVAGERDTYGGFRAPDWARNEWHGPARSGAAWDDGRVYWITGSRVLCLAASPPPTPPRSPRTYLHSEIPSAGRLAPRDPPSFEELTDRVADAIRELTSETWAPLVVEPGLAGRSVFHDNPADLIDTLGRLWPHLSTRLRDRLQSWLPTGGFKGSSPFEPPPWRSPSDGDRREFHRVPRSVLRRLAVDRTPNAFGNVAAIVNWCRRTDPDGLEDLWPEIESMWRGFEERHWRLDPTRGDLFANRYLASLQALAQVAREQEETEIHENASALADATSTALVAWWERTAREIRSLPWNGSREVDDFIRSGNGLFLATAPHRHRLALFHELTPEIGALLHRRCPDAVDVVWQAFERLCPTWWLVGEEAQVHGGENLADTPDFAASAFRALAFLRHTPPNELAARIDVPAGRGDLHRLAKLAITLDAAAAANPP